MNDNNKSIIKKKSKTKKNKKKNSFNNKLWDIIDHEKEHIECITDDNLNIESEENICKNCKSELLYNDNLLFCSNKLCGIIHDSILDFKAEWRFYGADDNNMSDPTRCGMPINPLLVESSFGCKVMCSNSSTYEMRKIKRYTEWQSMPYKEKSKYDDFQLINLIAKNSGIPKIITDDAIRYYDKLSEVKTFRGLNRDGILAASIYISFNINKNPRTPKEIAAIFSLDNTSATKGCKNALNILNDLESDKESNNRTILTNITPQTFIARYCSKLSINQELTKLCLFIAHNVKTRNLIPENTPHSIAAGIIYYVSLKCNLNISKKDINTSSQISEVTINKCYKKLEKYREFLIPETIIYKYNNKI